MKKLEIKTTVVQFLIITNKSYQLDKSQDCRSIHTYTHISDDIYVYTHTDKHAKITCLL